MFPFLLLEPPELIPLAFPNPPILLIRIPSMLEGKPPQAQTEQEDAQREHINFLTSKFQFIGFWGFAVDGTQISCRTVLVHDIGEIGR